ncbi:hypothetical protein NC653_028282 [Populus alba x Populus x berolinensis]|uniref:Uncharacterized protein n=1 Tax=Populus alba x Populus x berolinensis TaxID=444605 RepID=A0AAD6Q770_9ROSI|nr:hypothetical protein NC653_028282 [Populus alba x Populus x berolinensis]
MALRILGAAACRSNSERIATGNRDDEIEHLPIPENQNLEKEAYNFQEGSCKEPDFSEVSIFETLLFVHCLAYFWGFMFVFLVLRDGFLLFYGMDEWKMKPRFGFAEIWTRTVDAF